MKRLKHSVMVGLVGAISDRFHQYGTPRTLAERLEIIKNTPGADGMEIVYPSEFADLDESIKLVKDSGLAVSAVNLNVKSQRKWRTGSFTSPDPKLRANAVQDMRDAMDLAAEFGSDMISCCPLIDGHNYAFEVDYLKQWNWLAECIAEGARHRSDIKVSIEYKLNESRNFCILGSMGRTLYLCEQLGLPNIGVTMDVGHAQMAKESPAEVMCLAAQANRLFYVHFNDNGREWDWDMLPASMNLWDVVEMLFYLDRLGWEGWLSYDIVTRNGEPADEARVGIAIIENVQKLMEKLGREKIQSLIDEGNPANTFDYLIRGLL